MRLIARRKTIRELSIIMYMKGRSKRREESGVFLILFAILFLTIFSFVAIAVDTANVTIAKIRLYNAIDNAIMVAPIFYLGKKYDEPEIKARLNAVTRANYEADATDSAKLQYPYTVKY